MHACHFRNLFVLFQKKVSITKSQYSDCGTNYTLEYEQYHTGGFKNNSWMNPHLIRVIYSPPFCSKVSLILGISMGLPDEQLNSVFSQVPSFFIWK